jgi:hypothetical protein
MKSIFTTILILLLAYAPQDRITSAYKAIQKGEFEKARGLLEKQQEKTPEQAGLSHVWAHYFFAEKNKSFSLDSAYLFIEQAIKLYPTANPKDLKEWAEDSLMPATAKSLKANIEISAYKTASLKALGENDTYFLQQFIDKFPKAPQVSEATNLRNEIAWKNTEKANTIEGYQDFLNKFPNTVYQKNAIEKRDRLIFQRETKAGTLLAYQNFVKVFAGKNLYVGEAVEALYPLYTVNFLPETFGYFWDEYKTYPTAKKAWFQLFQYHKYYKTLQAFEDIFAHPAYDKEFQTALWQEAQQHAIFPFYEKESYGYLNEAGKRVVEASLENILPKHICQTQQTDYIQVQQNTHFGLHSVVGKVIFPAEYDAFHLLAPSIWRVNKNGLFGAMNENGQEILPLRYDAIEMAGTQLLKFKKNRRWGIATLHGQILFEPTFTEIEVKQNALLIAKQPNSVAIYKIKDFWKQIQDKTTPKAFEVESLMAIDSLRFQFKKGTQTGIINSRLDMVLPAQPSDIKYIAHTAFAIRQDSISWKLHNLQGAPILAGEIFQKAEGNHGFLLLKKGKTWGVVQASNAQIRHNFELDSVALLDKVLLLYKSKKMAIDFLENTSFKPIEAQNMKNLRAENGYLFFENTTQQKGLYDMRGTRVCAPSYQSIYPLTALLFNVQANGKYGIVDSVGKVVLPLKYDGIDTQSPDNYTLISNGKYGLFNPILKITTEANFDQAVNILHFSPQTSGVLGLKGGLKGLTDLQNKTLIPFQYKELWAWQDSTAIVQTQKGEWLYYSFAKKGKEKVKDKDREKEHTLPTHFQEVRVLSAQNFHVILQVKQHDHWGIWDNKTGERVKPTFQNIENRGTPSKPFYFADKKLPHHHYLVAYINAQGEKVWEKELSEQDYERLVCE